jgi:hypothetical protein
MHRGFTSIRKSVIRDRRGDWLSRLWLDCALREFGEISLRIWSGMSRCMCYGDVSVRIQDGLEI